VRTRNRILLILILVLLVVPAVMAMAWIGSETVIEHTGDAEFCTTCHTMEPFAVAHARDVHGGNNAGGVVAECTDCHLPHDNAAHFLYQKARTGLRDVLAQSVYWLHKPDWVGNLEQRAEWTYDSGCLQCHAELERVSDRNEAAAAGHSAYFAGTISGGCVACHQQVGHAELRAAMAEHFDEVATVAADDASPGEPSDDEASGPQADAAADDNEQSAAASEADRQG